MISATRVQILNNAVYIFHNGNAFGKGINQSVIPPTMGI